MKKLFEILYWDIWVLKFSYDQIIKAIGLILQHNLFGVTIKLFLLSLISKYVQKSKWVYT